MKIFIFLATLLYSLHGHGESSLATSLGRGVSTVSKGLYLDFRSPGCIDYKKVSSSGEGSEIEINTLSIHNEREFRDSLTARFGFGKEQMGTKPLFKDNFDVSYMSELIRKSTTSVGELTIRKLFEAEVIEGAKPSAKFMELTKSEDPYEVYNYCGNSFVYSFQRVAEALGYIICETSSETNKKKLDAKFKAFSTPAEVTESLEASAEFEREIKKLAKSCSIHFIARGGVGTIDIDTVHKFLKSSIDYISKSKRINGWVDTIQTVDYHDWIELQGALENQVLKFPTAERIFERMASSSIPLESIVYDSDDRTLLDEQIDFIKKCSKTPWEVESCISNPSILEDENPWE